MFFKNAGTRNSLIFLRLALKLRWARLEKSLRLGLVFRPTPETKRVLALCPVTSWVSTLMVRTQISSCESKVFFLRCFWEILSQATGGVFSRHTDALCWRPEENPLWTTAATWVALPSPICALHTHAPSAQPGPPVRLHQGKPPRKMGAATPQSARGNLGARLPSLLPQM